MLATAEQLVARELLKRKPSERSAFLHELVAHVAAGLVVVSGHVEAAETCYQAGDAVIAWQAKGFR